MPLPEWIENRLKATQDNAFMWDALYALAAWAEDEIANEKAPHHQHHCHYCAVGFAAQHLRFTLAEFAAWKDENDK